MNDNSTKIWKWLVILLAVLNIALLFTVWMKPRREHPPMMHMPPPPHGPGQGGPADMIIHELHLNEAQIKEFEKLRDEHRTSIRELQKAGHELRDGFFDQLKSDSTDTKKVSEMSAAIAANQQAIEMATFEHFKKVRKLCDAEQKKIFDDIINEVTKQMGRPPMGPGGPPPPPPH